MDRPEGLYDSFLFASVFVAGFLTGLMCFPPLLRLLHD